MNEIDKKTDEAAIRELIVNWAKAVRTKDLKGYSLIIPPKY
jgi:ketosteroid isomerase-like protein